MRRRERLTVSGMLMECADCRFHVFAPASSHFLASLFHVINKTSVLIRPLTVTVNSDGVMHFSTVFYFINVSFDVRRKAFECWLVIYEGALKVIGNFSSVLPICGGLMLFCWKSEVMTDLKRNIEEAFSSRLFLKVHLIFFPA